MQSVSHFRYLLLGAAMLAAPFAASAQTRAVDAWIRAMPPGTPAYAGYLEVHNDGTASVTLNGAGSDAFAHVMIHETVERDGVLTMQHVDRITIPPASSVSLQPGGKHLMLMRAQQPVKEGVRLEIVLKFEDGPDLPVTFVVRRDQ